MKRFLSLVLTLVMVMSLVTVSAGAKDFTDDDSITYDEAVAVISEIGVVDGDTNGAFRPTDTLTRQAAAKIICNLILGPTTASELHADTAPYRDVPVNNQFAGYIAYCQAKGIISGYADGSFRPTGTLTGYAFMKMLLGALGYDASLENYVGNNWSINVAKQAIGIGLNKGLEAKDGAVFNGIKAVTREEAALYAFNTLQADLVEYGQRLTTNVNGTEVTLSSGGAKSREWNSQQTRYDTIRDDNIVQFAEEYFNKLVKAPDDDIFMRPAHTWTYNKNIQIGTWTDMDKLLETYTTGVSGRDLYDRLGSATIRDYDLEVYVDGHIANNTTGNTTTDYTQYAYAGPAEEFAMTDLKRSNTDDLGITGNGVLTEVFKDDDAETIRVVSIHTWLGQATSAYNSNLETATVKVFNTLTNSGVGSLSKTVNVEDVPEAADVTTDTFYLVRMSDKDTTKLEVVDLEEPDVLEESTVTKFSNGRKDNLVTPTDYPTKLTTGGNEYSDSDRAVYDADTLNQYDADLLTTNTYNVYLDKYGYFIGIDLFEGTKQYVFVTGYDMRNSNLSLKTAEASGIFLDGTMETMTVNVKDTNSNIKKMVDDKVGSGNPTVAGNAAESTQYYQQWGPHASQGVYLLNRWYTYTKTDAGVYTLKPCVDKDAKIMMLASKTDDDVSVDDAELKMNCSKLRLDSVTNSDDARTGDLLIGETMRYSTDDLQSHRAYGEDASVFITVDVDDVSASIGGLTITKAITDVNGVYTGVQDVDLITKTTNRVVGQYRVNNTAQGGALGDVATAANDTWHNTNDPDGHWVDNAATTGTTDTYVGENAYAVFDKNNFIIGAVILGEAVGNNATKAWIIDPVKYERYENGTYYWQFEAVINGEIVTQEAESKFSSTIDTMRDNRYEIVELRYKDADNEIVTDVKEVDRTDTGADAAHSGEDKIYGYPFGEIMTKTALNPAGHKVNDNESIYDVVLTGATTGTETDPITAFTYVERPRDNDVEHDYSTDKVFKTTQLGTLKLQGRTLYVLDGQNDYGIDFVRDAKAVVRQPEGIRDASNTVIDWDWETRAYATVQEAIDSLGDANTATLDKKDFRGIITAVLNSQGVAEWIVFYSDTLVQTRNDTSIGTATMPVTINVKFPGSDSAERWGTWDAPKPATGVLVDIPNPDTITGSAIKAGYHPVLATIPVVWERNKTDASVTFEYVADGTGGGTPAAGTFPIRVGYVLTANYNAGAPTAANVLKYQEVSVPVSASGYGNLTADLLTALPTGYMLDPAAGTNTQLNAEINSNSSTQARTLYASVAPRTDITAIEALNATNADLRYGTNIGTGAAADLDADGVQFRLTFGTAQGAACNLTVDADDTVFIDTIADVAGTSGTNNAVRNGSLRVTAKVTSGGTAATVDVPVKIYATKANLTSALTGWTALSTAVNGSATQTKVFPGDVITVVIQDDTPEVFGATEFAALGSTIAVTPGSTSFTVKATPAPAAALSTPATAATEKAEITFTFTVDTIAANTIAGTVNITA